MFRKLLWLGIDNVRHPYENTLGAGARTLPKAAAIISPSINLSQCKQFRNLLHTRKWTTLKNPDPHVKLPCSFLDKEKETTQKCLNTLPTVNMINNAFYISAVTVEIFSCEIPAALLPSYVTPVRPLLPLRATIQLPIYIWIMNRICPKRGWGNVARNYYVGKLIPYTNLKFQGDSYGDCLRRLFQESCWCL